jgi:hypothetical protein
MRPCFNRGAQEEEEEEEEEEARGGRSEREKGRGATAHLRERTGTRV